MMQNLYLVFTNEVHRRALFTQAVFLLLGVGVLLPYNAFVNAKSYFQSRFVSENESLAEYVEVWITVLYNVAGVLSLAVLLLAEFCLAGKIGHSTTPRDDDDDDDFNQKQQWLSFSVKNLDANSITWIMVMFPLVLYLIIFLIMTVLVFFPDFPAGVFVVLTVVGVFLCGTFEAIASSAIIGSASVLEVLTDCMNPFFAGLALGGLLVAVAEFVASYFDSKAASSFWQEYCFSSNSLVDQGDDDDWGGNQLDSIDYTEVSWPTAAYFALSCFVLLLCMISYDRVHQYHHLVGVLFLFDDNDSEVENPMEDSLLLHPQNSGKVDQGGSEQQDYQLIDQDPSVEGGSHDPGAHISSATSTRQITTSEGDPISISLTLEVWKKVQKPAVALFLNYFVTLVLFPAWTSMLSSAQQCESKSRIRNDLFSPFSFILFNAGDLIGRMLSKSKLCRVMSDYLVTVSFVRFLFFPLFLLLCAGGNKQKVSPMQGLLGEWAIIPNDWVSWAVQLLFGISNGAINNIAFAYAPEVVENKSHPQQVASAILNLSLGLGLMIGSFVSYVWLDLALAMLSNA